MVGIRDRVEVVCTVLVVLVGTTVTTYVSSLSRFIMCVGTEMRANEGAIAPPNLWIHRNMLGCFSCFAPPHPLRGVFKAGWGGGVAPLPYTGEGGPGVLRTPFVWLWGWGAGGLHLIPQGTQWAQGATAHCKTAAP